VRRALDREGDNIMYWDGRDKDGTVVKGGIYIYQIEAGNKIFTGTVVVAK
jgi:flagellar hook assembly protein FlgD